MIVVSILKASGCNSSSDVFTLVDEADLRGLFELLGGRDWFLPSGG